MITKAKSKMKSLIFKGTVIAVILIAGLITVWGIPDAVESFLPVVETVSMTPTEYNQTVSGNGIITQTPHGDWYVTIAIGESDIRRVEVGQSADLSGAAFDDGIYTATVESVDETASHRQVDYSHETVVEVVLKIDNPNTVVISGSSGTSGESGGILRSGYSARADIKVSETRTIFVLPYSVILQDDKGEYVYVLSKNSALRRDIITGIELSHGAEVISGLRTSDRVILNPQSLSDNALVKEGDSNAE
ncbi:MAG: hypothetical protein FWG83_01510 [Oscillospiraceae bacterium]|nr:hypothetical protein [Oscillospiraceae bacterium]